MSVEWLIYLASVVVKLGERIQAVLVVGCGTGLLALLMYPFWLVENQTELPSYIKKIFKWCGGIVLTCVVLNVFIPSERTLYMIAGVALGKEAMHSEMATKVQKIIELKLNEELDKLTQTEKK